MRPPESFVGQPVRSLQTMLRVIAEHDGTIPSVVPDGIYGPQTMSAISTFQRGVGLPVTGITDQTTWEAVVARYRPALTHQVEAEPIRVVLNPNQVIRRGDFNRNLYLAQAMLVVLALDYPNIPELSVNGTLDAPTAAALIAFQELSGLPATGELDKITWKHLSLQFTLDANRTAHR